MFENEGEIKTFVELRELNESRCVLQRMLHLIFSSRSSITRWKLGFAQRNEKHYKW